jgi:hypothetical protein
MKTQEAFKGIRNHVEERRFSAASNVWRKAGALAPEASAYISSAWQAKGGQS